MFRRIFIAVGLLAFAGIFAWRVRAQSPQVETFTFSAVYQFNVLKKPAGLFYVDGLYIADSGNHVIRKFQGGTLTTVAGAVGTPGYANGPALNARFREPSGLWGRRLHWGSPRGPAGAYTELFISDSENFVIRKYCFGQTGSSSSCNDVTTVAGAPGTKGYVNGTSPQFGKLAGLIGPSLLVVDSENHAIRQQTTGGWVTFAGTGTWGFINGFRTNSYFDCPGKIARDLQGNHYVADAGNNVIRKIDTAGNVTTFAGTSEAGYADGPPWAAKFDKPWSIVFNNSDNFLYVTDSNNNMIRRIDLAGNVSTLAGGLEGGLVNGSLSAARFACPMDIALGGAGILYVSDTLNNVIRRIDLVNGMVSTYIS